MNWPEPGTPVCVRWIDAETGCGWWDVDEFAEGFTEVVSYGAFVKGGAWGVILAFSLDDEGGALGHLSIPGDWIKSVRLMQEVVIQ